jgi:hypothetical protein
MTHPGDAFIRHVHKRHPPPFQLDRTPIMARRHWRTQSRYRLLDARGDVIARFSRWWYAVLAYGALCERHGLAPVPEPTLRRWALAADWDRVKDRDDRRRRR